MTIGPAQSYTTKITKQQAVKDFQARGYNCTADSLRSPAWLISAFTYNRTWVNNATRYDPSGFMETAEFYYNNTATDSRWPKNAALSKCESTTDPGESFNSTDTFSCSMAYGREPRFRFDATSSLLTMNQKWTCDGIDSGHT